MNDSLVLKNILLEYNINQQTLSDMLGVKKQLISQIINGRRNISETQANKLRILFPDIELPTENKQTDPNWLISLRKELGLTQEEFANKLSISQSLYSKLELGKRTITKDILKRIKDYKAPKPPSVSYISYCPDTHIPAYYRTDLNEKIAIDDRFLMVDGKRIEPDDCSVVTICSDDLFPTFSSGDRVIIVSNQKVFKNGHKYLFEINNQRYIRSIKILPDKIKCISSCEDDTFYLSDTKGITILGMILPNIRL